MKILALETSAKSVSAAVTEDGAVLASAYQNTGLTHSRTLMPMVDAMLNNSGIPLSDIGLVAVAAGPGSFTGLRIGVSAAKGLAWTLDLPCCAVSTLEAMAWNLRQEDAVIVCAMDARRNQVYNALFAARDGRLERLIPDRAVGLAELAAGLKNDLTGVKGISKVEINTLTGSLLILHTMDVTEINKLTIRLNKLVSPCVKRFSCGGPPNGPVLYAQNWHNTAVSINNQVRSLTRGWFDMSTLLSVFFLVRGIRKMLIYGQRPSGPTMVWWALHMMKGWKY